MAVTLPKTLVANTPENINDVQSNFSALITALNALGGDVTGTLDATLIAKITGTKTRFGTGGNIVSSANNSAAVYSNYNAATDRSYDSTKSSWAVVLGDGSNDWLGIYRAAGTSGAPTFAEIAAFDLPGGTGGRLSVGTSGASILRVATGAVFNSYSTGSAIYYANYDVAADRLISSTKPGWRLYLNADGGFDQFTIDRAPATAGAPTFATLLSLNSSGAIGTATIPFAQVTGTVTPSNDTVTSAKIVDGTIVNVDVSSSAAIAYSKLALASSITSADIVNGTLVNADVSASAAVDYSKLNLTGSVAATDMATLPHVRVYRASNLSVSASTNTAIPFASERWDSGTGTEQHSTSSNTTRLTCQRAGLYQIEAHCEWASGPLPASQPTQRNLTIRLNGATNLAVDQRFYSSQLPIYNSLSTQYRLSVGDYAEAVVYQDEGPSQTINSTANSSPEFMMSWVGP